MAAIWSEVISNLAADPPYPPEEPEEGETETEEDGEPEAEEEGAS